METNVNPVFAASFWGTNPLPIPGFLKTEGGKKYRDNPPSIFRPQIYESPQSFIRFGVVARADSLREFSEWLAVALPEGKILGLTVNTEFRGLVLDIPFLHKGDPVVTGLNYCGEVYRKLGFPQGYSREVEGIARGYAELKIPVRWYHLIRRYREYRFRKKTR
jgi:hypothetical protein